MTTVTFMPTANLPLNDRSGDMYENLLKDIRQSFFEAINNCTEPLFVTDTTDLYDVFLDNLPVEARQHYNCRACRNFVNKYGTLVTIDDNGALKPVMWKYSPHFFGPALENVYKTVKASRVIGVFVTNEKCLGIPKTGVWEHMAVDVPKSMQFTSRLTTSILIA